MHLQYTLIFIFINLYCFTCSPYYANNLSKRGEKYCGSRLTSMLNLVCRGRYYGPRNTRSTHNDVMNMDSDFVNSIDSDYSNNDVLYPYVSKDSVLSLLPNKIRKSHGIVNECCYNPCTVDTMKEYCDY
ncbi:LIRP-like [Diabrotica virgifera virgifera]|uniref:LIRP-like n=1 Tax=Diabrotica virgifera virgifera TaxID=50390 RepID=A0A6P7F2U0_DIAVI|nr:LIRP-like [Diabrotica virgifera virgifera]